MLKVLKQQVYEANMELQTKKLVIYTWGNVSGIERETGFVVIKPSGISYEDLTPEKMVVVDLQGKLVEGNLKPSSDIPTHLELYKNFLKIGGIVHTHSTGATSWAQSGMGIPCYGTTHADYFYGAIPCTRPLSSIEIEGDYEQNIGKVIIELFQKNQIDYEQMPGVLIASHAPFTWGKNAKDAVYNSVVLEEIAKMALTTRLLNPDLHEVSLALIDKHFSRKHGINAYYGQK